MTCTAIYESGLDYANQWAKNGEPFVKRQVFARVLNLTLVPTACITKAIDTIVGLGVGVVVLCTLAMHSPTRKFARRHVGQSEMLICIPYVRLLKAINPSASFGKDVKFLFEKPNANLKEKGIAYSKSEYWIHRHVTSRLTFTLLAVSCIISRTVAQIIGVPVALLSILTLGKFQTLNALAFRSLRITGVISDLFYCMMKIVNPFFEDMPQRPAPESK